MQLKKKYGQDVMVFSCALNGSGDIFLVAKYLNEYLKKENIPEFVFLIGGRTEESVIKLFPDVFHKNYEIIGEEDIYNLMRFRLFAGCNHVDIRHFHHCSYTPQLTVTAGLEGYNGFSMTELYLYTTLKLSKESNKLNPTFQTDTSKIEAFFKEHNLQPHKTVILSPYSVSAGQIDPKFWERLTYVLLTSGYSVCTNSSGTSEPVIPGTVPVFFSFLDSKAFMEYAGYFIGYRSGLCDIIADSKCKKIIIYPKDVSYCLPGRAIDYVGLKSMGICEDALELEYGQGILSRVLEGFDLKERSSDVSGDRTIVEPAFTENIVAVSSAVSNEYLPYLNVTIQSIIDNSVEENNYDIVILCEQVSVEDKQKARSLIKGWENFSIRFLNVDDYLSQYDLPVETQYKPIIYARLMLPELMQKYERVVYIDADTILMDDIAKLYKCDLGENLLCAVRDTGMLAWYHTPGNPEREYIDHVLKLKKPDDFFNSGVIVFNIPLFHKEFSTRFLFEYSTSRFWKWRDQDVFMTLCDGRIGHVEQSWNVLVPYFRNEVDMLEDGALSELKEKYLDALENPKLVHFIGNGFLSLSPAPSWGEYYWIYAKKTKYYDELIDRAITFTKRNDYAPAVERNAYDYREIVLGQFQRKEIGFKYILKYLKAWVRGKLLHTKE